MLWLSCYETAIYPYCEGTAKEKPFTPSVRGLGDRVWRAINGLAIFQPLAFD